MIFELIAAVVAGVAAAGMFALARKMLGRWVPRVLIPIAAGGAMIAFGVWTEYNWEQRTRGNLPPGMEVVASSAQSSWFRPWSYVWPIVRSMTVVDKESAQRKAEDPGKVAVTIYRYARYLPPARLRTLIDCEARRRAVIGETGEVVPNTWVAAPPGDALLGAMCASS